MIDFNPPRHDQFHAWAPGYLILQDDVLIKPFPEDDLLVSREYLATAAIRKAMQHEKPADSVPVVRMRRYFDRLVSLVKRVMR